MFSPQRRARAAVEREHTVTEHELVDAGVALERIQGLRQCGPRTGLGDFRPKQSDERVSAHSFLTGGGKCREQDKAPPLTGGSGQRASVTLKPQASERLQSQHSARFFVARVIQVRPR